MVVFILMVEKAGVGLVRSRLTAISSFALWFYHKAKTLQPQLAHATRLLRVLSLPFNQKRIHKNVNSFLVETAGVEPASKTDNNKSLRVYSLFSRINQEMTNLLIYSKSFKVIHTLTIILIRLSPLPYCNLHGGSLLIGKLD